MLLQQWWQQFDSTVLSNPVLYISLLFSISYLFKLTTTRKLNLPPSPLKLPIIGNIHQLWKLPHRSLQTLSQKYGPLILLHLGQTPTLVVSSAEIATQILASHDAFLERPRKMVADTLFSGCTDIAFCPHGDYWRQAKKICAEKLLAPKRVRAFQIVREHEVSRMVEDVQQLCNGGSAINVSEMLGTITSNIISRSVFGRVCEREDGIKSFGELSRRAIDVIGAFWFKDYFPYLEWMDDLTGLTAKSERISSEVDAFLDEVIEDHLVMVNDDDDDDDKSDNKDFVDILLHLQLNGMLDIDLTQDNLKAILLVLLSFSPISLFFT